MVGSENLFLAGKHPNVELTRALCPRLEETGTARFGVKVVPISLESIANVKVFNTSIL